MGKKVISQALKISKTEKKVSLIKILKPKVYITDTSSFKTLVQELTGNGRTKITSLTPPPPSPSPILPNMPQTVIDIDQEDFISSSMPQISSMEPSLDASVESYEFREDHLCMPFAEEAYDYRVSSEYFSMNDQKEEDLIAYQDLESWLLDVDQPYPAYCYNSYVDQLQQEVSIYDYELSGLI